MLDPNIDFEVEEKKYRKSAKDYLNNPQKTEGLLKKAIKKAKNNKGTLGEIWENLQLFLELIRAYTNGEYRRVSTSTILTIIGAIIYFVSPLDVVPDFLIGLGILDDAAVLGYTIKKLSGEIAEFKKWKNTEPISITESPLE